MTKMKKILAAALAVVMLAAACGLAAAEQGVRKIETAADADEWIGVFLGEHPEELDGAWAMTAQMEAAASTLGGLAGMAMQLSALGTPVEIGSAYEGELQGFTVYYIPCVFTAMSVDLVLVVQDGAVAGLQTSAYTGGQKEEAESEAFDSIALALPVEKLGGELPGILTVPKGDGPFPAVILLQGSGTSDRDESVGALKPFRDIAEGLAKLGVAVYRFDKRTYVFGAVLATDKQFTLEGEYLEDAVNAVQLVARQDRIDPDRIYVLGHSLGGNAIPAVAGALEKAPVKARGFIMMAASPRPLDELMREQYDFLYSLMPEVTAEQQAQKDALFADLDRLKDVDALAEDDQVAGVWSAYWKWLAAYDILETAAAMDRPVLVLQGEEDYQVSMADFNLWKETFGEKENWTFISYPGLTHVFTHGQKAEGSAVYTRSDNVDEQAIKDIAEFVLE